MNKHSMQVTMPLEELERIQAEIDKLKKESIRNYYEYHFPRWDDKEEVSITIDQEKLIKDLAAKNEEVTVINVHTRTGLLVNPIKVNGGIRIGDELIENDGDTNATNN